MDFFPPSFKFSLALFEHSERVLILIVVCQSNSNNFATLVGLDSAEHTEEETKTLCVGV